MKITDNRESHNFTEFVTGIGMIIAGLVILLMNIHVVSFGFYRFGRVSTAPVLLVVFIFLMVLAVARGKMLYWILVAADVVCIIISVILGTELYFGRITALALILMLGLFASGVGLVLKNISVMKEKKE